MEKSFFLPQLNNMKETKFPNQKENLTKVNNFGMFKWNQDTVVYPRDSEWMGYYNTEGNMV